MSTSPEKMSLKRSLEAELNTLASEIPPKKLRLEDASSPPPSPPPPDPALLQVHGVCIPVDSTRPTKTVVGEWDCSIQKMTELPDVNDSEEEPDDASDDYERHAGDDPFHGIITTDEGTSFLLVSSTHVQVNPG